MSLYKQLYQGSKGDLLDEIDEWIQRPVFQWGVTLNPLMYMAARQDPDVFEFIKKATFTTIDGVGIAWASGARGQTITGVELADSLLQKPYTFFVIGATLPVISQFLNLSDKRYPNANILGFHHGYMTGPEKETVIRDIIQKQPDIILVGMGVPLQEKFISELGQRVKRGLAIGIGGSFDVLSGSKRRAPKGVQRLGMEWLYRSLVEPHRLKTLPTLIKFVLLTLTSSDR